MVGLFLDGLESLVAFFKLFVFLRFGGKRFDNALAQQAVLDRGVQLADLEALLAESGAQAQVEAHRYDHHQRHTGKKHQCQRHAGPAQDDEGRHDLDGGDEEFLGTVVGKLGHIKQVVGDAAHDLPDLGVGIVCMAQALQVGKRIAAHVGLDIHAHDVPGAGHIIACRAVDDAKHKIEQRQPGYGTNRQHDRSVGRRVGQVAHDGRQDDIAQRCQRRAEKVKYQDALIFEQIGQKAVELGRFPVVFGSRHGFLLTQTSSPAQSGGRRLLFFIL